MPDERHRVLGGDCLQVMKDMPDESVDMILTDLPYGTTECAWDEVIPMAALWEQYLRVAKPEAAIVLTAAQPFTSKLVMSRPDLFRYEWIWEKGHATGHLNAKKQPLRAHESALVFYRKQPIYNPKMTRGHERKTSTKRGDTTEVYGSQSFGPIAYDSTERYPRTVQFFSSDKQSSSLHPTQKPVALMRYLIETYTAPDQVVLDSCAGSGTTAVACAMSGRRSICIEQEAKYLSVITERIESALSQIAEASKQADLFGAGSAA